MDLSSLTLLAQLDLTGMSPFLWASLLVAVVMLIWDTVEVGRNDAANLVNAVFGARILSRRNAVWVAGVGVVLGASMSSGVIETARKGIFDTASPDLVIQTALAIYIAVYIVDTVLLYGYSAFGMPVSTTACLVFELLGASFAVGGFGIVQWDSAGTVVLAIVMSIVISGIASFFVQRVVRGSIGSRGENLITLLLHGGWAGGGMLAMLAYFMVIKGMKSVGVVKSFNESVIQKYDAAPVVLVLWLIFAVMIHLGLVTFRRRFAKRLFPGLAIIGTLCMGFAFGQNDLANCASPGLAALKLIEHREDGVALASQVNLTGWMLLGCGVLLLIGMLSKRAHRVTQAAVSVGSMSNVVALYAPNWCLGLARRFDRARDGDRAPSPSLAPSPLVPGTDQGRDYDSLRACVILGVSASVIAMASSFKLPVSTTYVTFAAVVATGAADRILQRGDAALKMARTIWVVFSWFSAAVVAAVAAALVCKLIVLLGLWGIVIGLAANFVVRIFLKNRGDRQMKRTEEEAEDRLNPELFTDYED